MARQLRMRSIEVVTADGGPSALEQLRAAAVHQRPFDLAMLDMQMQDMDGEMLLHAIQADPIVAGVPLARLTSLGHAALRDEAARLRFVSVLSKPVRQLQQSGWLERRLGQAASDTASVRVAPAPLSEPVRQPDVRSTASLSENVMIRRILVAEDSVINQRVVVRLLERLATTWMS
ncbi:MAG: response regulator [Chloroflexota bacterium]